MNKHLAIGVYTILILVLLAFFVPQTILMSPAMTPIEYLQSVPYKEISLFGNDFILIKPSSTFFVYLLGFITMGIGVYFAKGKKMSRHHFGISLVFWGLGAVLAGTSYQGLGYELKCNGYYICLFTSWWELAYLYVTGLSITVMMFAILLEVYGNKKFLSYPMVGFFVYSLLLTLGSIFEIYFLITYEMFILFFGVYFVIMFVISLKKYMENQSAFHRKMIEIWVGLLIVNVLYFVYMLFGIGPMLYEKAGIWFTDNDVLHIALIGWMVLILVNLKDEMLLE